MRISGPVLLAVLLSLLWPGLALAASCPSSDVVVYGATPAGIAAAIQAARLKAGVTLLEPTQHVGGMMTNGLTKTDASPRKGVYGGIVEEFLDKAYDKYEENDEIRIYFESKWAEKTMQDMLAEAGVNVVFGQRISAVRKPSRVIEQIDMASGNVYCGSVYVDASYEGDLMALSGASTILGRESSAQYGESAAGAQTLSRPALDDGTVISIDPYLRKGDPSSGLLPGIIDTKQQPAGSADGNLMAFNYRLCVTEQADNRAPFTKPSDYDPMRYEALARFIEEVVKAKGGVSADYFVGNAKTVAGKLDVNSTRYFSTNVWNIGAPYVMADEAGREAIRKDVRSYTLGYLWFGQTDPRVPEQTREMTARFGLCADEFTDNDHFPRQLYVRQARRLVGQYVLTQNDILEKPDFPDSIGLGYYTMDQHGMIRTVVDGFVADEVRNGISSGGPYEIPLRSLLPKADEVTNLIVPVALSASHVAFTSVRVEPTFMVLGQAAGAAAALAPGGDVNKVDVQKLQDVLGDARQVMSWKKKTRREIRREKPSTVERFWNDWFK